MIKIKLKLRGVEMKNRKLLSLAIASVTAAACMLTIAFDAVAASKSKGQQRYIVKYKDGQAPGAKAALKKAGGKIEKDLHRHSAVAITLPSGKLAALLKNDKIEYVEIDELRSPGPITRSGASGADVFDDDGTPPGEVRPYGVAMVQAEGMVGNTNSGIKVCVIDSGYDINHEDKPIGPVVTGTDDLGGSGPWDEDGSGHGSHVSGTINALDNDIGVIGVFPSVPMHIVRVFGDDGVWAYSSELVDALDDCMDNGAQIVSMSLGAGWPTRLENAAFRKAEKAGVLSIAAAGNDADWSKPGFDRMHYPSSYHSVMSVAAVDHEGYLADFSQRNTTVEIAAPGVAVLSTVPTDSMYKVTLDVDTKGSFDAVPMDNFDIPAVPVGGLLVNCGLAETAADCGGAEAGFTCLIERGGFSFAQKAVSCETAGGAAAAVYQRDGVDGPVYGTLGDTYVGIPVVGMARVDGLDLLDNALGLESLVNFALTGYDYDYFNGTSMATPHVSGVAALVWSTHPTCTNVEIRNALNATAMDLGPSGPDHYFGNGLVQAQAASDFLDANPCSDN